MLVSKTTRRDVVLAAALAASLGLLGMPAQAADDAKVKTAMQALKDETTKLGPARLDGEVLYFGTTKINDNFTVVDDVKAKHGGTATLFIKKGNNFVRVSTKIGRASCRERV